MSGARHTAPSKPDPAYPVTNLFGPTSSWRKMPAGAPVNSDSRAMVADLAAQVRSRNGGTASFNVWSYNAAIVKVAQSQKRVTVHYDDCQHKGHTPSGLYSGSKQFVGVPIPDDAVAARGRDEGMTIWSPQTDQLWDFWKAHRAGDGWHACWGGRIDHLWSSQGYFTNGFGASASGLASAGGAIRVDEVRRGRIDHAVGVGIRDYASWKKISWPAQRSDGSSTSASKILMGTRFVLPRSVDVDRLDLTPIARMIAVAAQNYGLVVSEKSGVVAVAAESGAPIAAQTGEDPWTRLLGRSHSYDVLAHFPWNQLRALPKDYGEP